MSTGWSLFLGFMMFLGSWQFRKTGCMVNTGMAGDTAVKAGLGAPPDKDEAFFEKLFKDNPGKFDSIILHRVGWNVQIVYTQIDRHENNIPTLQSFYYNKKDARYFYPASAIKLPIAILALQKLHEMPVTGIDLNSTMITETGFSGQQAQFNEPNSADGRPTVASYIKQMLLVSDNNAYNRLYEFLGQDYINKQLAAKGYKNIQVLHRLGVALSEDENRHTNPVWFYNPPSRQPVYKQPMQFCETQYPQRIDFIGKAYYSDTTLVNAPMDFSKKNKASLEELHQILLGLIMPERLKPEQRFNITEADRRFLLQYLSEYPRESLFPTYDSSYYDAWAKFILLGGEKTAAPKGIRIFNKIGEAYGQLTDIAYVVDYEKKIEFMVSATIYCNKDEVLNDDQYDYESIGLPFMKNLGKALYDYELKRKRNYQPDLSLMMFSYDN